MGSAVSVITGIGMAIGPPCIYLGQVISIRRKKDSEGFSPDVCAVLLIANVCRCVFWLGKRFEFPLLMQSICLILAMLGLQYLLLKYRRAPSGEMQAKPARPFHFWQWDTYGQYIEFLAALIVILCVLYLVLGGFDWFIDTLGFIALGLESQLPTPQLIKNYQLKSTAGLQLMTIAGWLGGDIYKTVYFYLRESPSQFIICGLITVTLDLVIVGQRLYYGAGEAKSNSQGEDGDEQDVDRAGQREAGTAEESRGLTANAER